MEGCAPLRCLNKAGPSAAREPLRLHSAHAMQQAALGRGGRRASPGLEELLTTRRKMAALYRLVSSLRRPAQQKQKQFTFYYATQNLHVLAAYENLSTSLSATAKARLAFGIKARCYF